MDASLVTLIVGLLGGGTAATLVQFFVKRKDTKNDELATIKKDIEWIKMKSGQRDVNISQLKILNLIQHNPKDHKAIMMECDNYFLVLKADSWVLDLVGDWATTEGVNIDHLKIAHANNAKVAK